MPKKRLKEKVSDKKTIKINIVVSILFVAILSFVSVGYALYGQILNTSGTIGLTPQGKIAITDVTLTSSKNVKSGSIPAFTDDSVDFNLTFEKAPGSTETDYQAVYSITIDNGTFYDYDFNLANFQPVITNSSGIEVDPSYLQYSLSGISLGDSIPAGEDVTFTLTLDFNPPVDDTYSVDGDMNTDLEEQPHGSVIGSIPDNSTADLRASENKNIAEVTVSVINSYQSQRAFTLGITDSSHFVLVDSNEDPLGSFTIAGGQTSTYTIYIKRVDNASYSESVYNTNITLSYAEASNTNCGSIAIQVDQTEVQDTTPPEISGLTVTVDDATSENTSSTTVGSITLSWTGTEPESAVKKYHVIMYKNNSSQGTSYETPDSLPTITITGLEDASYSFKVYGENTKDVVPTSNQISSCNDAYCSKTTSTQYTWHFNISLTNDSTNIDNITPTAVNRGKNVTVTISPASYTSGGNCGQSTTNYYTLSNTVTVKMNGNTMSTGNGAGQYTFSRSTSGTKQGTLNLYGVTGNITIKATASQ